MRGGENSFVYDLESCPVEVRCLHSCRKGQYHFPELLDGDHFDSSSANLKEECVRDIFGAWVS